MRHITQGTINRYVIRAQMLFGTAKYFEWASTMPPVMGRRAMLKALRDYMTPKNRMRDARRAARRRK